MSALLAIRRVSKSRLSESQRENPEFGSVFSDHMFVADYVGGHWGDPRSFLTVRCFCRRLSAPFTTDNPSSKDSGRVELSMAGSPSSAPAKITPDSIARPLVWPCRKCRSHSSLKA